VLPRSSRNCRLPTLVCSPICGLCCQPRNPGSAYIVAAGEFVERGALHAPSGGIQPPNRESPNLILCPFPKPQPAFIFSPDLSSVILRPVAPLPTRSTQRSKKCCLSHTYFSEASANPYNGSAQKIIETAANIFVRSITCLNNLVELLRPVTQVAVSSRLR
jgi:hypothetical protein